MEKNNKIKVNLKTSDVIPELKIPISTEFIQPRKKLYSLLFDIKNQLIGKQVPQIYVKSRSKSNLVESLEGYWGINDQKFTKKTMKTKGGAKELLKLVHVISYMIEQIECRRSSTLRELYYCALNWIDEARFEKVNDSNHQVENIEILTSFIREELALYPGEEGKVSGPITLEYVTRNKTTKIINCAEDVGASGFTLPRSMDELKVISHDAKFVLAVETAGIYSRLIEEGFDKEHHCILVCTGGQSSRITRKFISHLRKNYNLRTAVFTDGDLFGLLIAHTILRGSIKASHLSGLLCVPDAIHIGLFPSQIKKYGLPTDTITKLEKERTIQFLEDIRFKPWWPELQMMLDTSKKAEQQAFAYLGIDYVSKVFLPEVLKDHGFL